MARRRKRKEPIPALLGMAFAAAAEADEARAQEYLKQAVSHGYTPNVNTERRLWFALRDACRDRGLPAPEPPAGL